MHCKVLHFCKMLTFLCASLSISAQEALPGPLNGVEGFSAADRFALVRLLTPEDPDGFIVENMEPFKIRPLFSVQDADRSFRNNEQGSSANWGALAGNYALLREYLPALKALEEADPTPDQHFSFSLLRAWLLDKTGRHEEARTLYTTLSNELDSGPQLLRLRIGLELRQKHFQAAQRLLNELQTIDEQPVPASTELLRGLMAYAVRDDHEAFQAWTALSRRPPSEQQAAGMFGLASLSHSTGSGDAAVGWMIRGLSLSAPSYRYAWLHSPLSQALSDHPEYPLLTTPFAKETEAPGPAGDPLFLAYMDRYEELQTPDIHLKLKVFEKDTKYRTLQLLKIDDL